MTIFYNRKERCLTEIRKKHPAIVGLIFFDGFLRVPTENAEKQICVPLPEIINASITKWENEQISGEKSY